MKAREFTRTFRAFSLVEVVLAIGVVGFSVLAILGLLSVASQTNKRAKDEASAARLVANEFERLRSLSASSPFWPTAPNTPPIYSTRHYDRDLAKTTTMANAVYALSITFGAGPAGTADLLVNAEVRYPAQASPANQSVYRFTTLMNTPIPTPTPTP
jgi:type II secretory pathway pseudopilin PulG